MIKSIKNHPIIYLYTVSSIFISTGTGIKHGGIDDFLVPLGFLMVALSIVLAIHYNSVSEKE